MQSSFSLGCTLHFNVTDFVSLIDYFLLLTNLYTVIVKHFELPCIRNINTFANQHNTTTEPGLSLGANLDDQNSNIDDDGRSFYLLF